MFPDQDIPLSKIYVAGNEITYIERAIQSGTLAGPGPYSVQCERLICQETLGKASFLVPSCSVGLEMSALLLNIGLGDEVIMPSFTFVSMANAVVLRGAVPVFIDVDPVTFNLDPAALEAAITIRTRAVFVIHYAGVPADMTEILRIATQHGIAVVEDAAQAYGSSRDGRPAGSFAPLACFSFHGTKNLTAGEAGALVINEAGLLGRAAVLRDKGTDRARFLNGEIDAYTWQDIGSSQIVSELVAAFLLAQLESATEILTQRMTLWKTYHECLSDAAGEGHFHIPKPPINVQHNAHIFFLILSDRAARASLCKFLKERGITASTHYVPLHSSPAGQRYGRTVGGLDETQRAADCLLRLPLYHELESQQHRVISAVLDWVAAKD